MITINKKQYNFNIEEAVLKLRADVKTKRGLDLLRDIKRSGNELMVTCPYHKNGQERKPSLGINTENGLFHCFTCDTNGVIHQLISYCLGYYDNGAQGIKWIKQTFEGAEYTARAGLKIEKRQHYIAPQYVSESELDTYRYYHPYMWKRKLTPEIVTEYDIGYDKDTDCLTIPVYDLTGNCVFVARRSVKGKFFNYPEGVDKPVYGLNFIKQSKLLFVCESAFNALTLVSWGFPAVALLGTGTPPQYEILKKCGFRKYVLCLDGDTAGDRGIQRFMKYMNDYAKISYIKMPRDGRDVNDLTLDEFLSLTEITLN